VVSDVDRPEINGRAGSTLVTLQSVEDGRYDDELEVIWEVEPGAAVLPVGDLPPVVERGFDPPDHLAAFLDAVRWSAVTSADVKTLQSPFRSGVVIEDYQLEPVARALDAPRVNLLLADDVGLGKTIEAGLVALELMLRHRGKRVMIVCPAGLTTKWHDEMAEKFGLQFTVIDSEQCALVRRVHGSAANPFQVYPLTIVSLPWLRGQKAQRLLAEVLPPGGPGERRVFDLLILDEAHHVAPAAPKQAYAVDSQQTKLIRSLAPHFTHRLFLSATPHNGYQESFTALLEIVDDQRFARGVEPTKEDRDEVVVRRLKQNIRNADGTPRFRRRISSAIPVRYPPEEREIHAVLERFAQLRRQRAGGQVGRHSSRKAADLITLLLKKRLFSSPAAFTHTVRTYRQTLAGKARALRERELDDRAAWLKEFEDYLDDLDDLDDEQLAIAEDDALDRTRPLQPDPEDDEAALLERMEQWAVTHQARPDAKATALIETLKAICLDGAGRWTDERVVVFTEYRDTQDWLADLLRAHGLGGDRVALLHGGLDTDEREQLRLGFQAAPSEHPVRVLIATDAASEGIDLQDHCHRLINYDIPFNPNKLEQRIGRIDRYGQRFDPEVRHFVGTGWEHEVDTFQADLEFLSRVATKVAQMESDLGPVNAVLSEAVQRRMRGERVDTRVVDTAGEGRSTLPANADVGEQVRRLRANLDATVDELGITPMTVWRVVETALTLARQQPLQPVREEPGLFEVPPLTGAWQRATVGLTEKLRRGDEPLRQLPVTFDQALAQGRDDVVLAHLNHPLVAMSTRLLRGAASNADVDLHRVAAVVSNDPQVEDVLVAVYARFVLVGGDGVRLHEEVLLAGGWLPETGRFRREGILALRGLLDRALTTGSPASELVQRRIVERWERGRAALESGAGLLAAVNVRARERRESLEAKLAQQRKAEEARTAERLDRFAASLRRELADDNEDTLFNLDTIGKSPDELAQYRRDREQWQRKLDSLDGVRRTELNAIAARYRDPQSHVFPMAVVFVVPRREATR
jgi:superfamily II DNA or RNA helicase